MIKKMHLIWIALCPLYEHDIPAAIAQNYCDSNHKHLWVYSPTREKRWFRTNKHAVQSQMVFGAVS